MSSNQDAIRERFSSALDALVDHLKKDRSILAAMLCGSLSHDVVWEKSDIDLMLVTVDDKDIKTSDLPVYADGVNVHAMLVPRAEFRKMVEGSLQHSFIHSFLSKGRLLYTHDETIATLCERLKDVGRRDTELQLFRAAATALPHVDKARKWFVTRRDLDYSALWILYAATPLAKIEIISHGLLADREVLPQAAALNPEFFKVIYTEVLNTKKTTRTVHAALDAIDAYVAECADLLFAPIVEYLEKAGEARSATEIETYFSRQFNITGVTTACEYLADQGRIGKASIAARLTKRSNADVQELAFFVTGGSEDRL